MKFFKKITAFKGGKPAEKEVGLAVPSVTVISAVALNQPVAKPESQDSDLHATEAGNADVNQQKEKIKSDRHDTNHDWKEIVIISNVKRQDDRIDTVDDDEEYKKALEENIYLKEKNSLLLQLVFFTFNRTNQSHSLRTHLTGIADARS